MTCFNKTGLKTKGAARYFVFVALHKITA